MTGKRSKMPNRIRTRSKMHLASRLRGIVELACLCSNAHKLRRRTILRKKDMSNLLSPYITRYLDPVTGKRVSKGQLGHSRVRVRAKKWSVRIKNAAGKWDAFPLSPKKEAAAILSGQKHDKAEMAKAGVVDRYEAHRKTPLAQHLKDWQASLEAKECTAKHVQMKVSRVQAIIDHCKFVSCPTYLHLTSNVSCGVPEAATFQHSD